VIRATAITQARRAIREESDTGAAPAILSRPGVGIPPHRGSPRHPRPVPVGVHPANRRTRGSDYARLTKLRLHSRAPSYMWSHVLPRRNNSADIRGMPIKKPKWAPVEA
jgi:hypothetical protein